METFEWHPLLAVQEVGLLPFYMLMAVMFYDVIHYHGSGTT